MMVFPAELVLLSTPHVVTTRRGAILTIRRAYAADIPLLADLIMRVSAQTHWRRFFAYAQPAQSHAWREAQRMVQLAGDTLVATVADAGNETAVAVAELAYDPQLCSGEMAIMVQDDYQRQRLGMVLGRLLVARALRHGLTELYCYIQPDNQIALRLVRQLGVPSSTRFAGGLVYAQIRITDLPVTRSA